jgi:cytochrome P450
MSGCPSLKRLANLVCTALRHSRHWLSAEGEQWRIQRRTHAPVFARKNLTANAPDMMAAAQALVERWRAQQQSNIDVSAEMSRLTLEVLQQTIFSDALGRDAERFRIAMRTYFVTIGWIDPLDVLGVP